MVRLFLTAGPATYVHCAALDARVINLFHLALLTEGVLTLPGSNDFFLSFAHTEADILEMIAAAGRVLDRLGDGVTLLWEPHVHPLLRCNIWHVEGRDSDLLIDTGLGVASLALAAKDLFDKPLTVVLTHCHMDHAGGAHEFAACCVHAAEAEALTHADNHLSLDVSTYSTADLAWFSGIGYDISGGLLTAIPHAGFDPKTHRMQAAANARLIAEGDVISTGQRAFEVLHLPGHSPGSIALWEKSTGILFSGDAIYDGP
eukprot:gene53017-70884_t